MFSLFKGPYQRCAILKWKIYEFKLKYYNGKVGIEMYYNE